MRETALVALMVFVGLLIAACDFDPGTDPSPPPSEELPETLRGLADMHDLNIGTAVPRDVPFTEDDYTEVLTREFNTFTPENATKWNPLRPTRTDFSFQEADALVELAEENAMDVRGHTLVWHNQNPSWLVDGDWSREEAMEILEDHISTVVGHYRGRLHAWDVVNEAFEGDGSLRETIWLETIGPEYIEMAFRWAREADPDVLLYYNDYNIAGQNPKSDAVYGLVQELVEDGVPIDGVGFQSHLSTQYGAPTAQDLSSNMQRFADLGLRVDITEIDVRIPLPATSAELEEQADYYARFLNICLQAANCSNFTIWGFTDKYSWVPHHFEGMGAALIFDEKYEPKPAYHVLLDLMERRLQ